MGVFWIMYQSILPVNTPRANPHGIFERAKFPPPEPTKGLQNHGPWGKKILCKTAQKPHPLAKQEPKLQHEPVLMTQIFDDILNRERLGSICFKSNIITFLLIQFRCCEHKRVSFLLFLLASSKH